MSALSTREALAKSAAESILYHPATFGIPLEDRKRLAEAMADSIAREAVASGAVVDAASLADDEALVEAVTREICKPALEPAAYLGFTREHFNALATALTEREA